jgi:hypothetical protein
VKRLALVLVLLLPASAAARRPGPELLYARKATAPQLQNTGVWKAKPILVSGATAYRRGEFLYQDFLYDDHGAHGTPDPADARLSGEPFSLNNGTLTYPTDPVYAQNAADLVELRVRPLRRATAFRVTLNSMKDPARVAVSLALGGKAGAPHPFPAGAGVQAPADRFVTVHGTTVDVAGADGTALGHGTVRVDRRRRQLDIRVPHRLWNPRRRTVRLAAGVGLWGTDGYLAPGASATATAPGGAGGPAAFFNVAFRPNEPLPDITTLYSILADTAWWRDKQQAEALAAGDISPFSARVDFGRLRRRATDNSAVPRTGPLNRILASHFETAQGVDHTAPCDAEPCPGPYTGRLQPYSLYVPVRRAPRGYGSTLLLHPFGTNYNLYTGSFNQSQLGDRGTGSVVITPESRGPAGGYTGYALADVFDVWNDVARHYKLDPGWSVVTGYSMGGIGTFELAELHPDLYAAAEATAGADETGMAENLRHIPMLMWNMAVDEEVTADKWVPTAQRLDDLAYRYELDVFAPGEHNTFAVEDQYAPVAAFLGTRRVPRHPAHVTFTVGRPDLDVPKLGLDAANHAYWLSAITPKDPAQPATVDAIVGGTGDAEASPTQHGADVLTGTHFPFPALAYTRQYRTWGKAPPRGRADRLAITATNVASLTVHTKRAGLTCAAHVDGPAGLMVALTGC